MEENFEMSDLRRKKKNPANRFATCGLWGVNREDPVLLERGHNDHGCARFIRLLWAQKSRPVGGEEIGWP